MNENLIRYAEYGGPPRCTVLEWPGTSSDIGAFSARPRSYSLDKRPKWLVTAVNIGKIGGFAVRTVDSDMPHVNPHAPTLVMWFTVTPAPRRQVLEYRRLDVSYL